jgi:DNA adenine methylase
VPVLKSPYPYFGGKSRVAGLVWSRFGNPPNYVEPFFGSGAVLLARPHPPGTETVNDLDALLCNFWRALAADPDAVAKHAAYPVSELDLLARNKWLIESPDAQALKEALRTDPHVYDARLAGWWVWGICAWIGSGWCEANAEVKLPELGSRRGVHRSRKLPYLSSDGQGINRQLCDGDDYRAALAAYFRELQARTVRVRICCGDWTRVMGRR